MLQQYNELPDDLRDDEEMRAELHQTLDDLRERLWNMCDERKEQAEKERSDVMNEGWLDDRLGLMSNFFITVMQGEVDRFQDTVRLLKDYYRGMEGKIPDEIAEELARVPLIEVRNRLDGLEANHFDGLVQERRKSSALAMELLQCCIKHSILRMIVVPKCKREVTLIFQPWIFVTLSKIYAELYSFIFTPQPSVLEGYCRHGPGGWAAARLAEPISL